MVKMNKKPKKSIGILTNPSETFKIMSRNRVLQVKYDQMPKEIKNKKQSFLDFLGGNFQEINTLVRELSCMGIVSVVLHVDQNLFISERSRISPHELIHPRTIKKSKSSNFHEWLNGKDALIISLNTEKLREFINLYHTEIDRPCVISTGRSMINELSKRFPGRFIFVQRKGVARFGAENRQKILALLRYCSEVRAIKASHDRFLRDCNPKM